MATTDERLDDHSERLRLGGEKFVKVESKIDNLVKTVDENTAEVKRIHSQMQQHLVDCREHKVMLKHVEQMVIEAKNERHVLSVAAANRRKNLGYVVLSGVLISILVTWLKVGLL